MSGHSRRSGTSSPPPVSSTLSHLNGSGSPRLNIVSRLAIEGKAKHGEDGASIKLFLRLTIPVESVSPGMTVALFAEENIKVRGYQIHPINSDSKPYDFSSSECPLIHKAARALNLPRRSSRSYLSLFDVSIENSMRYPSSSRVSQSNGKPVPPLDEKYTGSIVVSGYNVSYVLPKEFPPKQDSGNAGSDNEASSSINRSATKSSYGRRRSSIIGKDVIQFVAGLNLWLPFVSKPPRAPFHLSIPIPRCLSNTISVGIFPPKPTSASFASLSSEEETSGWDLTTDPHVTRTPAKHSTRSSVYNHFADDESSDSSVTGFADGCGIQGTFPSSDRVRIRWASPINTWGMSDQADGRRRVGVNDVQGELTCTVIGHDPHGIRMRLNYQGSCKGVWFPGVATLLGLDVSLDAQGCDIFWPTGQNAEWQVDGEAGFTGFDVGSPSRAISRQPSMEFPQVIIQDSSPSLNRTARAGDLSSRPSRSPSITSSASLLYASLPTQISQEYSFEATPTPSVSDIPSISSLTPSSANVSKMLETRVESPSAPITIHLNMNDLAMSTRNNFTFNISGVIIVSPSDFSPTATIPIPLFRVLTAERESNSITIRSHCDLGAVEVLERTNRHNAVRKAILQYGAQHRCSTEKPEIMIIMNSPKHKANEEARMTPPLDRHRTPNGVPKIEAHPNTSHTPEANSPVKYRDGPLVIPWVTVTVYPLLLPILISRVTSAVKLCLPAPVDSPTDWLEFGLAMPNFGQSSSSTADSTTFSTVPRKLPSVEIASASLGGIPVRFETFAQADPSFDDSDAFDLHEKGKRIWLTWVRVYTKGASGDMEILYTVKPSEVLDEDFSNKGKAEATQGKYFSAFLPLFSIPVARMEVVVEKIAGIEYAYNSSMPYRQDLPHCSRFYNVALEPFQHLELAVTVSLSADVTRVQSLARLMYRAFALVMFASPIMLSVLTFNHTVQLTKEIRSMNTSFSDMLESKVVRVIQTISPVEAPMISTTHTSALRPTSEKWWLSDSAPVTYPSEQASSFYLDDTFSFSESYSPKTVELNDDMNDHDNDFKYWEEADAVGEVASLLPSLSLPWSWDLRLETAVVLERLLILTDKLWYLFHLAFHWPARA